MATAPVDSLGGRCLSRRSIWRAREARGPLSKDSVLREALKGNPVLREGLYGQSCATRGLSKAILCYDPRAGLCYDPRAGLHHLVLGYSRSKCISRYPCKGLAQR